MPETLRYKRNHFSARLPVAYSYSPAHVWLVEAQVGLWRVGLTSFATRMLGEIVEFDFEKATGARVENGELFGWIEGFKAVSDLYCAAAGSFRGPNPLALENPALVCQDPYGEGWLYAVEGAPDLTLVTDVAGYVNHLDETIDRMLDEPWKKGGSEPPASPSGGAASPAEESGPPQDSTT